MPELPGLLYKGSVKNVHGVEGRDPYYFSFSDRYSIFDWGEMPDVISGKGEALATMGDLFFRILEKEIPNFSHHSLGLVNENLEKVDFGKSSRILAVKSIKRILPKSSHENGKISWDYSAYASRPVNTLVPLEVVFRFGSPEGSSFLKRVENNASYLKNLGLTSVPKAGTIFPFPIIEFFTKLESTDRYLDDQEAQKISGMNEDEFNKLKKITLLLATHLKELFRQIDLQLWDGKFEFSFLQGHTSVIRDFQLVDSIGPDELRIVSRNGVHVSKEILRKVYRNSSWYQAVEEAKKIAYNRGEKNWKFICIKELKQEPEKLSSKVLEAVGEIYPALVDALMEKKFGLKIFSAPPLEHVIHKLGEIS